MNEQVMMIRVAAVDLSGMVEETESLRYRLQQSEKARSEESQEWRDDSNELLRQFNGFRRAVQEALGFDQPELLHDDELIVRVKHAALCQLNVKGFPWKTFSVDVVERPRPDHADDGVTYVEMIERDPATLADGTQARFFSDQRPDEQLNEGPPTESMPPVETPPEVEGFKIGRVFTRGDSIPEPVTSWWSVVDRAHDVYGFTHYDADNLPVMTRERDSWLVSWPELLHMHGTVWEAVPLTRDGATAGEQVPGE